MPFSGVRPSTSSSSHVQLHQSNYCIAAVIRSRRASDVIAVNDEKELHARAKRIDSSGRAKPTELLRHNRQSAMTMTMMLLHPKIVGSIND